MKRSFSPKLAYFSPLPPARSGIADYNAVLKLDPKFAPAYYNRGMAYLAKGDKEKGAADLKEAGRLDFKLAR